MRRSRSQLHTKPSMAKHFLSLSAGPDIDLEAQMFTGDVHSGIMPIGGRRDRQKKFDVELQGDEKDCTKAKEIIRELGQYEKYAVPAMLCDAVNNVAKHLSWEGQTFFEILNDGEHISFNSFTSKNLFSLFNYYLQVVPPGDRDMWKRKFSFVHKKYVLKIEIPCRLGGVRGYKKILKKLRKYNHVGPVFYRQNLERGTEVRDFNLLEYTRNSEIYFNRVTRAWGWNRRDWSQQNCTEFYTFYKYLDFKYAQAILREHIIQEINKLLVRISVNCEIVVTGLPTAKEILEMKRDMQQGDISFTEVSDKLVM